MGLMAYVYRNADHRTDYTNHGWSSIFTRVCVVNAKGPFEPSEDMPSVRLVKYRTMNHVYVVSEYHHDRDTWPMMGGNYLSSSDSRFKAAVREILGDPNAFVGAIPIHDRVED